MTDTTTPIVLVAPPKRWWAWAPAILALLGLALLALAALVPSQLFAEAENARLEVDQPAPYARIPASAESVNDRVVYGELPDDVEVFDTNGDFFFVTISQPPQSVLSWLIGSKEPVYDLLTEEARNGRRTATQNREISLQQMRTATQEAQFVALTAAGYEPTINLGAVIIEDLLCIEVSEDGSECLERFPSASVLQPADTILEVEGTPVPTLDELTDVLAERSPGDVVAMKIDRPGTGTLDVEVELAAPAEEPTRTIVGFAPFDSRTVEVPFDVSIDTNAVGGPSAGLAFTLALVDELTEGDLTGGRNIAVTGTIRLDGTVGPIGGLEQKVSAVRQHGVSVFLIPAEQFELSEPDPENPDDGVCRWECLNDAGEGDVVLIPVATLDDALDALETLGGDPIPRISVAAPGA